MSRERKTQAPRLSFRDFRASRPAPVLLPDWPQDAINIPQSYGAIFNILQLRNLKVGTCGLSMCLGVILYTDSHVFIAHFDETRFDTPRKCADAAIDRLRELSPEMKIYCHLVVAPATDRTHRVGVTQAFNIRKDRKVINDIVETVSEDFYVEFVEGSLRVIACQSVKGDQDYAINFNLARASSESNTIYKIRTEDKYLHRKAIIYEPPVQ